MANPKYSRKDVDRWTGSAIGRVSFTEANKKAAAEIATSKGGKKPAPRKSTKK